MDKSAIDAATVCLAKANKCLQSMRDAKAYPEFESAWSDFLLAAGRIFSKLEQGAKVSGTSNAWFGRQKHERRTDPLLRYIHHARNADEHGIQRVTELQPGSIGIGTTGTTHIKQLIIQDGNISGEVSGDPLTITVTPGTAKLVTVFDHGDTYDPPIEHAGAAIVDTTPVGIGDLAIVYLTAMIEDARKLA